MDSKIIYLVDDDYIFRTVASVLLKRELGPVEIYEFENGLKLFNKLETLNHSQERRPNIILLDINMPVMNGWEFLEELKNSPTDLRKGIQIHILTSSIAPEDINLSRTYEFIHGYITKPLTKEDIEKVNVKLVAG